MKLAKRIHAFGFLLLLVIFNSCSKEEVTGTSISQLFHLKHKGATMPILVEGNIDSKVIVLMLHGGPGSSYRHINRILTSFTDPLEEKYAVAYWDQRMASGSRQTNPELTLDLVTEDTDKVIDLLRFKFGDEIKIFLLGHSWGGMLGTNYLLNSAQGQQKIAGWIEVAGAHDIPQTTNEAFKLINKVANEQISNNISTDKWSQLIDSIKDVDTTDYSYDNFLKINPNGYNAINQAVDDGLVNQEFIESDRSWNTIYNGLFGEFSPTEHFANRLQLKKTELWEQVVMDGLSLSNDLNKIALPSLFAYGKYDFVVPPPIGIDAYNKISTPEEDKRLVIFEKSGHLPFDSEVDLFLQHLIQFIEDYK